MDARSAAAFPWVLLGFFNEEEGLGMRNEKGKMRSKK